jgi:hypothetical protein
VIVLASLPGKNSRLAGAQTVFPAGAPLRRHGARKNLQIVLSRRRISTFTAEGKRKERITEYGH